MLFRSRSYVLALVALGTMLARPFIEVNAAKNVLAIAAGMGVLQGMVVRGTTPAFLGTATSPEARVVKGAAVGTGFLVLGFEFEYATTDGDTITLPQFLPAGRKAVAR